MVTANDPPLDAAERVATGAPGGKVLYIEDQASSQVVMSAVLSQYPGIRLIQAECGDEGVRLVRSERPDVVLLDMHLPDFNGLEVVRSLSVEISQGLKVVLLTADTLSMDIIKAMSLGAYEYWAKSTDTRQLVAGLLRVLGSHSADRRHDLSALRSTKPPAAPCR